MKVETLGSTRVSGDSSWAWCLDSGSVREITGHITKCFWILSLQKLGFFFRWLNLGMICYTALDD